ncbi:hypothetical protein RND81_14G158100 [Saponaria officinalis]|uniref:RRM domain-containing protein n=1 Tax=Saponaria officinalis TaxID=3572 RepID=A0AAW1GR14_SAPOF
MYNSVELTSVYVRSLPLNVTNADLEKEFKNFGKIKPNGVFIRNKKEIGVCFAFVEFENMSGVHNAIKEDGSILDFSGSNLVNVDDFAFGLVARYFQLDRRQCCFPSNLSRTHASTGTSTTSMEPRYMGRCFKYKCA